MKTHNRFYTSSILTVLSLLLLTACGGGGGGGGGGGQAGNTPVDLWTWVSGSDVIDQAGSYGAQGTAAVANVPGARNNSISWTDAVGDLWLFGGFGYDSAGTVNRLNDLWRYDGADWIWVSGSDVVDQSGSYGAQGTAAAANVPGARERSLSWIDAVGDLWLFGGRGYDSAGTLSRLNDLWRYQP